MLSFIIIGLNESWKLTKCFISIFDTISYNNLKDYEVIYIDSKSTDDSIERVKMFISVKIFKLTGDVNAAIARNVGAKESKGDVLFFIDGDMEIIPSFLPLVYTQDKGLLGNFVSGNWINYYYDRNDNLIRKEKYHSNEEDKYHLTTGGLFLITKELWYKVSGMNNKYRISQDLDFGLKVNIRGYKLLRKSKLLAKHHTIEYKDNIRMWNDLFKGNFLYANCVLLRDHLLDMEFWKYNIARNYTFIAIIFFFILSIIFSFHFMFIYLILVAVRALTNYKKNPKRFFSLFSYYIIKEVISFIAIFVFWPTHYKNINYIKKN